MEYLGSLMPLMQEGGISQTLFMFVPFIGIFVIFYFLILRPQKKKEKETKSMREDLKKNDKVYTIGGIRGVVANVKESTVVIKVDDSAKIEFSKNAIAGMLDGTEDKSAKEKK